MTPVTLNIFSPNLLSFLFFSLIPILPFNHPLFSLNSLSFGKKGFIIPHNIRRVDLAGRDLTNYLSVLLSERQLNFTTSGEMQTVRKIKEELSYVALDYEKER